jgi:hypothetical protein
MSGIAVQERPVLGDTVRRASVLTVELERQGAHKRARKGHGTNTLNTLNKERGLAPGKLAASASPIAAPERKPETYTEDEWRERLEVHASGSPWPEQHWGPKPGNPDCLVPRHLLVKPLDKQVGGRE